MLHDPRRAALPVQQTHLTLLDAQLFAISKGGRCLTEGTATTRIEPTQRLLWQCSAAHTLRHSYNQAQRGEWCSRCKAALQPKPKREKRLTNVLICPPDTP